MSTASTPFSFSSRLTHGRTGDASSFAAGLRDLIRRGDVPVGERLPSERRLADELSLPRAVVRASLIELEREGLLECTHGSGRQVARPGRRLRQGTIAVVTPAEINPGGPPKHPSRSSYQAGVVLAALQRREQPVLVVHPNRLIAEGVDWLRRHNVMGLVVIQYNHDDFDLGPTLEAVHGAGIDLTVYSSSADEPRPWDRVFSDHAAGAAMLTRWLVEQGRPRILRFWRAESPRPWIRERDLGHEREMRRLGLEPLAPLNVLTPIGGDLSPAESPGAYEPLIAMEMGYLYPHLCGDGPRIDAIMTATDRHALEVSDAVRRLGLTPGEDVAVVGYDHMHPFLIGDYPRAVPPAASIDRDNDRIGRAMSDLLVSRLSGELPPEPRDVLIEPTLVVTGDATPPSG